MQQAGCTAVVCLDINNESVPEVGRERKAVSSQSRVADVAVMSS
jgi:hypothetical protein